MQLLSNRAWLVWKGNKVALITETVTKWQKKKYIENTHRNQRWTRQYKVQLAINIMKIHHVKPS